MKKSIYIYTLIAYTAVTILTSCGPSAQNVDAAKASIETTEMDLIKAKEEYYKEYNELKYISDKQLADNTARIVELKKQSKKMKQESKAEYEETIDDLQRRNDILQSKINESKEYSKEEWESFNREFNHDMNQLIKLITDIGRNNVQ